MIDPRTDTPIVRHSLAVALAFDDMFAGTPVRAALRVSIPSLAWDAVAGGDGTYRFVWTIGEPPAGTFDVDVVDPAGEYRNFEPLQITLPHTAPTPSTRQDWLIRKNLWPTRKLRLAQNETALVGRLESAGVAQALRKVRLVGQAAHTFSDENGEFLAYFPDAKRDVLDTPPSVTLDVTLEIDNGAASVSPSQASIEMGTILFQRFEVT